MFRGYDDDDTFRSITLPANFDLGSAMSLSMAGDPYSENDDVCRGLAMGSGNFDMPRSDSLDFECDSKSDKQMQFFFGDAPPALPLDPDFRLECTTIIIENSPPEQVGNGLLALLKQRAGASISKVSRKKFSVKAYVHVGGLSCDVKVRVYSQEVGFAVEFQRRSGDALALQGLFRLASEELDFYSRAAPFEQHAFVDAHGPAQVQMVGQVGSSNKREISIAPLLDMARSCASDLSLQAEVAEALAHYASDANVAWQLSTPDALEVRENLTGIAHVSVAHPMRRLSAALAHVAQSNVPLVEGADSGIFPAVGMLDSGVAPPPPPLMRL
jgi:hypothetical protein